MRLQVQWDVDKVGKTGQEVAAALRAGTPSIWVRPDGDGLAMEVHTLRPGEEETLADALHNQLAITGR
jgi:hypothetical protein